MRKFCIDFSVSLFLFDIYASGSEFGWFWRSASKTVESGGLIQGMIFLWIS